MLPMQFFFTRKAVLSGDGYLFAVFFNPASDGPFV